MKCSLCQRETYSTPLTITGYPESSPSFCGAKENPQEWAERHDHTLGEMTDMEEGTRKSRHLTHLALAHLSACSQLEQELEYPRPPSSRLRQSDLVFPSLPLPLIQLGGGVAPSQISGPTHNSYFLVSPVTAQRFNGLLFPNSSYTLNYTVAALLRPSHAT